MKADDPAVEKLKNPPFPLHRRDGDLETFEGRKPET
jgi:hypothetical protein